LVSHEPHPTTAWTDPFVTIEPAPGLFRSDSFRVRAQCFANCFQISENLPAARKQIFRGWRYISMIGDFKTAKQKENKNRIVINAMPATAPCHRHE
jgi:hypothetical protein